jgi:methyl-accepting chemotaxis protein
LIRNAIRASGAASGRSLPHPVRRGRLVRIFRRAFCVTSTLLLLLAGLAAAATILIALVVRRSGGRRQRAVRDLLDAADQLEARLRTARAELEAVAGDGVNPVRDAMQEMLRQRLWLQQHGATASVAELETVRASFTSARQKIDQQLVQIERARAQFG